MLQDVTEPPQFDICSLPGSMSFPMRRFEKSLADIEALVKSTKAENVVCLCRRGNDSQLAAIRLEETLGRPVFSMKGGLEAWTATVDQTFPTY